MQLRLAIALLRVHRCLRLCKNHCGGVKDGGSSTNHQALGRLKCFACEELSHRQSKCKKATRKGFFFEAKEHGEEEHYKEDGMPQYDGEEGVTVEYLEDDYKLLLVV